MLVLYNISLRLYYFLILVASPFHSKAKHWIQGRKNVLEDLKKIPTNSKIYWFHCASLGEFEQSKPLIEQIKKKEPQVTFLVTFFSPSGYEHGKKYKYSDYVFYLPLDTTKNSKEFIRVTKPSKVFFIKYEFWYNYLTELKANKIPTYLISGVFRNDQPFFKWYGSFHRKMLSCFQHFFVQNSSSEELLNKLDYSNVTVSGDTRIDRVHENSKSPNSLPIVEKFKDGKKIIILGSSWEPEEKILSEYIASSKKDFKYIIAPHDVKQRRIQSIQMLLKKDYVKYSEVNSDNLLEARTLIIDNIGILSMVYQYTDIAFVGGGFSGSLHNILEPASFENVILFGPKHNKFHEAIELINRDAAYEIKDVDDFIGVINHLCKDNRMEIGQEKARLYIKEGVGASMKILEKIGL